MWFTPSIALIAIGAILRFAISDKVAGIDLDMVGVILMIAGVAALIFTAIAMQQRGGRSDVVERDREVAVPERERVVERDRRL